HRSAGTGEAVGGDRKAGDRGLRRQSVRPLAGVRGEDLDRHLLLHSGVDGVADQGRLRRGRSAREAPGEHAKRLPVRGRADLVSVTRRGFLAASALAAAAPATVAAEPLSRKKLNGADVLAAEGYRRLK